MSQSYVALLVAVLFVVANAVLMVGASHLLSWGQATDVKRAPYESGIPVLGSAHERFSVKFYLVAMLFILLLTFFSAATLVAWRYHRRDVASPRRIGRRI